MKVNKVIVNNIMNVRNISFADNEKKCLTCKYNVRDSHTGLRFCACFRSEYFTEQTGEDVFEGCDKWEDARK